MPTVVGCEREPYMREWQAETMLPRENRTEYRLRSAREDMLEVMAGGVEQGDVVAIEHSDRDLADEYEYFLLLANGPGHVLEEAVTDDWGAQFVPGDTVVEVSQQRLELISDLCLCRAYSLSTPLNQKKLLSVTLCCVSCRVVALSCTPTRFAGWWTKRALPRGRRRTTMA